MLDSTNLDKSSQLRYPGKLRTIDLIRFKMSVRSFSFSIRDACFANSAICFLKLVLAAEINERDCACKADLCFWRIADFDGPLCGCFVMVPAVSSEFEVSEINGDVFISTPLLMTGFSLSAFLFRFGHRLGPASLSE